MHSSFKKLIEKSTFTRYIHEKNVQKIHPDPSQNPVVIYGNVKSYKYEIKNLDSAPFQSAFFVTKSARLLQWHFNS